MLGCNCPGPILSHNISLIARLKHYTVGFLVQFFKPLSHFVRTVTALLMCVKASVENVDFACVLDVTRSEKSFKHPLMTPFVLNFEYDVACDKTPCPSGVILQFPLYLRGTK